MNEMNVTSSKIREEELLERHFAIKNIEHVILKHTHSNSRLQLKSHGQKSKKQQ
jgi:hypothetical protein